MRMRDATVSTCLPLTTLFLSFFTCLIALQLILYRPFYSLRSDNWPGSSATKVIEERALPWLLSARNGRFRDFSLSYSTHRPETACFSLHISKRAYTEKVREFNIHSASVTACFKWAIYMRYQSVNVSVIILTFLVPWFDFCYFILATATWQQISKSKLPLLLWEEILYLMIIDVIGLNLHFCRSQQIYMENASFSGSLPLGLTHSARARGTSDISQRGPPGLCLREISLVSLDFSPSKPHWFFEILEIEFPSLGYYLLHTWWEADTRPEPSSFQSHLLLHCSQASLADIFDLLKLSQ